MWSVDLTPEPIYAMLRISVLIPMLQLWIMLFLMSNVSYYADILRGPPGKPTNLQVLELKDHGVRLGWSTGYDYGLQETVHIKRWIGNEYVDITQANVQTKSTGFQHVEKEVYNLNSSTSYRIILVSENSYGLSQQSEEIIFVTKEQRRKHLSHSASGDLSIIIPVSIVGALALIAVVFAIVHLHCKTKKGSIARARAWVELSELEVCWRFYIRRVLWYRTQIAQSVIASAKIAEGLGFDSRSSHIFSSPVTELAPN
ncbi:hypothetical protein FSP39_001236 [Pinctada imbricata]|uniref:Fibronectin type-III domain-containing protein n=1 Tax=Pinctada imbricata TaxID=66713 RepID=A0AA89BSV8_PINIB|nr:hypothetical protein FSP39_001236 [Pinctada imbricata]